MFENLQTIDVIQAMLVLPLEHKRMQQILNIETKMALMGELQFWLYHLRDLNRALMKTHTKEEEIVALQNEINRLEKLLPNAKVQQRLTGLLQFVIHLKQSIYEIINLL